MNIVFSIFRNPRILLVFIIILAVIIFLSMLLLPNNKNSGTIPIPVQNVPSDKPTNFKLLTPTTSLKVSPTEIEIKNLITITSDPPGARVLIDVPEQDVWIPEANSPSITPKPVMTTPFKITNVSEGKHTLSIFRDGYLPETKIIEVGIEKEMQINIILKPAL